MSIEIVFTTITDGECVENECTFEVVTVVYNHYNEQATYLCRTHTTRIIEEIVSHQYIEELK